MLPHRVRTALRLALVLALLAVGGAGGQTEAPETAAETQLLRLRAPARSLLSRLQVGWIAWLSAINEDDAEEARAAVDRIQAHAAQVDMPYLPELSLAASLRAVEAVRAGQLDRARLALEGAEALDPGEGQEAEEKHGVGPRSRGEQRDPPQIGVEEGAQVAPARLRRPPQ
ncbi:MAG: hypothetical protein R3325_16660, partial [Thermoanaerobaculia bacterium]|nr:hypothetical protein [Thermoanaerobaculia bacterium]